MRNNIVISQRVGIMRISGTMVLDRNDVWNNLDNYVGVTPDTHSVSVDPGFQQGSDNYHLQVGSPLIDLGSTNELPARDFDGDPRPLGAGPDIGADESIFFGFTDDPLVSGTTAIKAIHFTELRTRINALRMRFGLPPFSWTDTVLTGLTVNAVHLQQLRDALVEAYLAAIAAGVNVTLPSFVENPLMARQTVIKTIHIEQLREAVLVLERAR